jgi:PAS domain S-box-containing protein
MVNKKILIVDDEPLNISLYYEMLKHSGFAILKATDGLEAIKLTEEKEPDLVILDWNMPRMDGLEALKVIKKGERTKEIPVIMITGVMTSSENLQAALQEGAIDFLRKPFDKTELQARVRSVMLLSDSIKQLKEKYLVIENSNRFIRSLIESVPHPLVWYTLEGIVLGCNSQVEQISDLKEAEIISKSVYRHLDRANFSFHLEHDIELINVGIDKSYESCVSEIEQTFIFSKSLFRNVKGEAVGILCIMTDVTEMKRLHQEVLESKKRELVSSALRLIQVNELNNQLISELGRVSAYTNKQGSDMIRNIIHQYSVSSGEGTWKDFEMRFEQVYEVFYKRLMEQFPDLTPGERKLCALLRLNVSSKDIAAITFQNPQSVDMARYRLRKKLNLTGEDNLVDFLTKIDS